MGRTSKDRAKLRESIRLNFKGEKEREHKGKMLNDGDPVSENFIIALTKLGNIFTVIWWIGVVYFTWWLFYG